MMQANPMWNSYLFAEQKVEVKLSTYANWQNRMILFSAKLVHKRIHCIALNIQIFCNINNNAVQIYRYRWDGSDR